ncbi:MAG: phosphotransferase [Candidatus Paceibacterota bacterium]|jgi:homoserine kinase type II
MSIYFTKSDCGKIAETFRLGTVAGVKSLQKGFQTPKTLLRTSKGSFVVSKYTLNNPNTLLGKSVASLQYEIDFLTHLKGLPVPHYVKSVNGKYIEKQGDHWVTVDKFIGGSHPEIVTESMARQLGKFLGAFHQQGRGFRQAPRGRRRFYDMRPAVVEKMAVYAKKQDDQQLASVVEEVLRGVERTRLPKGLPQGIVHVDIKSDNELFAGEKLKAVLDFGNMYKDALLLDVGKVIMWNCVRHKEVDTALVASFIKGYEEKRRLSTAERKYLKRSVLFAIYSHIWVDLYHLPLKYVPASYVRYLVRTFLPVARKLEGSDLT